MDKNNKRGFSGLSDLVSDVRHDGAFLTQAQKAGAPLSTHPQSSPSRQEAGLPKSEERSNGAAQQAKATDAGKNNSDSSNKWVLTSIIGVCCFVIWLGVVGAGRNNKSYSPPPTSVPQSHAPQKTPNPVTKPTTTTTKPTTPIPTPPTIFPQESQRAELQSTMPPIGTDNVLSVAEIRWCIAESIGIDTLKDLVDNNKGVAEFNKMAQDYNNRCGSYRYRQGSLERAQRDVEPYRSELVAKATQYARRAGFY